MGPFQKIVHAWPMIAPNAAAVLGPMSSPSQPAGTSSTVVTRASASAANSRAASDVGRQLDWERQRIVGAQLLCHLAADQDAVGATPEILEHGELVVDLRSAGHDHEWVLHLAEQATEVLELGKEQKAGVRGQEVRDRLRRAVSTMRRSESVVDEQFHPGRELLCVRDVVARLARIEARVFEHPDALVGQESPQSIGNRCSSRAALDRPVASVARGASRRRSRGRPGREATATSAGLPGSACRLQSPRPRAEH